MIPYMPRYSVCEPSGVAEPPMNLLSDSPTLEGAESDRAALLAEHPNAVVIDWLTYIEPTTVSENHS